jgi:hypothetical protein
MNFETQVVNLFDCNFSHVKSSIGFDSSCFTEPEHGKWVRDHMHWDGFTVFTDEYCFSNIVDQVKSPHKIAWLMESSAIIPNIIEHVKNNTNGVLDNFDMFMTHDLRFLDISEKFIYVPTNALPWIQQKKIFNKSKNISMIGSNKVFCDGHQYRQGIIQKYKDLIDHFGRGFESKELPWVYMDENSKEESGKMLALRDYRYSIAMENDDYDIIFCEKLTDCFATGTIPIFWGSKKIVDIFNKDGIIFLEDFNIELCTEDYYHSKMDAIKENFEITQNMTSTEDYFYLNYVNT